MSRETSTPIEPVPGWADHCNAYLQKYLLLWLLLSSGLAFAIAGDDRGAAFIQQAKSQLGIVLIVTMFCVGCLLPADEVKQLGQRIHWVAAGTLVQYVTMPLLAYGIAHGLGFQGELLIGLILVGSVPGAMASNVLTLAARGNVSYSVSLTTLATILSPVFVPLALWFLLGQATQLNPASVAWKLAYQVVLPVLGGFVVCQLVSVVRPWLQAISGPVANLAILWIIAVVVGLSRERLMAATTAVLAALLLLNIAGYTAGWSSGRLMKLPEGMRRALTLEVGMQNAGVGTVLATQLFPSQELVVIPPAVYTFGCMLTGTILAAYWGLQTAGTSEINEE